MADNIVLSKNGKLLLEVDLVKLLINEGKSSAGTNLHEFYETQMERIATLNICIFLVSF